MGLPAVIVEQGSTALISWVAQWIRERPGRRGGAHPAEGEPAAHGEAGCPACKPHRELAEARGLAETMVDKADYDGSVPPHIASTVLVVRENLVAADHWAAIVAGARPDLAGQCQDLRTRIAEEMAALPDRSALDRAAAVRLHGAMTACWRQARDLADDYWRPGPDPELRQWVNDLPAGARAELAAILNARPDGGR